MEQKPNKNSTESAILGLEMQVSNLQDDLDHMTVDCELFRAKLREMNKAVKFVKTQAKIVSSNEFKRLQQDIIYTTQQIYALEVGIVTVNERIESKLKAIEYYNMLYDQEQEFLARKILPFVRNTDDRKE
jgi:predicted  nucleic acid-binding Zn-ribbon protein